MSSEGPRKSNMFNMGCRWSLGLFGHTVIANKYSQLADKYSKFHHVTEEHVSVQSTIRKLMSTVTVLLLEVLHYLSEVLLAIIFNASETLMIY